LFIHGIGATASSWKALIKYLPGRCVAWNAPGYGGSSPLGTSADLHQYVDALSAVLRSLGEEQVHIVGHSWGTLLAARLANDFPQRVRSLALLNPTSGYASLPLEQRNALLAARLSPIEEMGPAAIARSVAPKLVSPRAPSELLAAVRELGVGITEAGMRDATQLLFASDLLQIMQHVGPSPMLMLTGDDDAVTGCEIALAMGRRFPAIRHVSVAQCGHLAPLEVPERTAVELGRLWNSCP
jgi:pimeloyl-ACP methyl ester carboxylesterase